MTKDKQHEHVVEAALHAMVEATGKSEAELSGHLDPKIAKFYAQILTLAGTVLDKADINFMSSSPFTELIALNDEIQEYAKTRTIAGKLTNSDGHVCDVLTDIIRNIAYLALGRVVGAMKDALQLSTPTWNAKEEKIEI